VDTAEILRVEAGRPRFGLDIDGTNLPDEAGLATAISATKGCYVGQEIVARRRTYGRMNRRLVGFRFPDGPVPTGTPLSRPDSSEGAPQKAEAGRVASSVVSPRFGPIGLGFAFHDIPVGGRLVSSLDPRRSAIVSALPFA
jgi:folate-binding protein YgfZ